MNAVAQTAPATRIDLDALVWVAIIIAAVAMLVGGSLLVRATNDAQARQAPAVTAGSEARQGGN